MSLSRIMHWVVRTVWLCIWPGLVLASLAMLCLTLGRFSPLMAVTIVFWGPIVLLIGVVCLCEMRWQWQRIVPIIVTVCIFARFATAFVPALVFASEIAQLGDEAPFLALTILRSGKPRGERLIVLRDQSGPLAGEPFDFLVYDDTGVLGRPDDYIPVAVPSSFASFSDENAQLCIGRSKHFLWRFYLCSI